MNQPLRILQVVASLQGGAAQHILHLSEGLQERGHEVIVVSPDDNRAMLRGLQEADIQWIEAELNAAIPRAGAKIVFATMGRLDPDILHVHGHRAACAIRSILHPRDYTCVYTLHGFHSPNYPNPVSRILVNTLERWQAKDTDLYICVSKSTQDDLHDNVAESESRSCVIPNAIPMRDLSDDERSIMRSEIRAKYSIPEEALVIGCIARLQWQKAVHRLIHAFSQLMVPEAYLLLVGDGPERKRIKSLIEKKQINKQCILTGAQPNAPDFLHAMDLFVLPSLWEGMPLTILEAWEAEVPVVATDVPGSRDLIQNNEIGWLAPNSTQGLIDTLNDVLMQYPLWKRVAREARHYLMTHHSISAMVDTTEAEYIRLIHE